MRTPLQDLASRAVGLLEQFIREPMTVASSQLLRDHAQKLIEAHAVYDRVQAKTGDEPFALGYSETGKIILCVGSNAIEFDDEGARRIGMAIVGMSFGMTPGAVSDMRVMDIGLNGKVPIEIKVPGD